MNKFLPLFLLVGGTGTALAKPLEARQSFKDLDCSLKQHTRCFILGVPFNNPQEALRRLREDGCANDVNRRLLESLLMECLKHDRDGRGHRCNDPDSAYPDSMVTFSRDCCTLRDPKFVMDMLECKDEKGGNGGDGGSGGNGGNGGNVEGKTEDCDDGKFMAGNGGAGGRGGNGGDGAGLVVARLGAGLAATVSLEVAMVVVAGMVVMVEEAATSEVAVLGADGKRRVALEMAGGAVLVVTAATAATLKKTEVVVAVAVVGSAMGSVAGRNLAAGHVLGAASPALAAAPVRVAGNPILAAVLLALPVVPARVVADPTLEA
ncbi:hypothetical protein LshimejAT787_1203140 [Lyophyllum shimeji]|uniref:Uncharacterized protein n=1 Tax=Lyophyllum shimeji TaxID=47721 RepID=A0A9P3UST7_LYOSH|nr:hypothetical protein LshimejAT787_1203140 [Lyophyllum shimeji]